MSAPWSPPSPRSFPGWFVWSGHPQAERIDPAISSTNALNSPRHRHEACRVQGELFHVFITHAAVETLAIVTYRDVDICVRFPAPEGVERLASRCPAPASSP